MVVMAVGLGSSPYGTYGAELLVTEMTGRLISTVTRSDLSDSAENLQPQRLVDCRKPLN
jgi:hypothetical protein